MRYSTGLLLVVFMLAGCGGGRDLVAMEPPSMPQPELEPEPQSRLPYPLAEGAGQLAQIRWNTERTRATPDDALQMPVMSSAHTDEDGNQFGLVYVGIDQGPGVYQEKDREDGTPESFGEWRGYEARYGRLNDGAGPDKLSRYFSEIQSDMFLAGRKGAVRYKTPPEVRLLGSPTHTETQDTIAAVQALNVGLPSSAKVRIGEPLPDVSFADAINHPQFSERVAEAALENVIHIEFLDAFEDPEDKRAFAFSQFREDNSIAYSYIPVSRENPGGKYGNYLSWGATLVHELLHTVGMYGHVDTYAFNSSISNFGVPGTLTPVDREALRVLYGRLQPRDPWTDPAGLGPWTAESLHFHANGPFAGFGVTLRNGYAEPWAYGFLPAPKTQPSDYRSEVFLIDNPTLSGTVTWNGTLLGVSPLGNEPDDTKRAFASVAGDAQISVNLDNLTGRADFTNLEAWDPNPQAVAGEEWAYFATPFPGEPQTGRTWGDGDLNYDIAVQNNGFRQIGGDDGILSGHFTGHDHEGAAGTLERSDLTAAFGAER